MNTSKAQNTSPLSQGQKKTLELAYLVRREWDDKIIKKLARRIRRGEGMVREWYTNMVSSFILF